MSASPHTTEQDVDEHRHTNRLIKETSPYLLQHAHNPVNWYAWGPDAFEAARTQNKPIFLSIGYSTCYWCHVMERESFEIEEVAALMNAHFISIKVDREERPDVDDIYMAAVQEQTGGGGWPMSSFLEPYNLRPFYTGTYFPKPQFMALLTQVNEAWQTRKDDILAEAVQLASAVTRSLDSAGRPIPLGEQQIGQAQSILMQSYDRQNAGFGGGRGNKFPMPVYIELLIAVGWDDPAAQSAILHTLDRMATGGMYDQIGGGFHRYSTDPKWLVPHFEKMIYDNGQLASVYAEAYERSGDPFYGEVVREVLDFVMREMTDPAGGFYSAQDAEVNTREGENYIWTAQEIRQALGDAGLGADIEFTLEAYGFSRGTNFRDPHHPEDGYKNVVYLIDRPDVIAQQMGIDVDEFNERLEAVNAALLAVRDQRDQPGTDDKILAAWNGLMIAGMADGGRVLDAPGFVDAARAAAQFVLSTMRSEDGGLLRTYRAGQAKIDAFSVDYAFMIRGLIALHRATGESQFVDEAVMLTAAARDRFWDYRLGAYFDTLPDQADLFVRTKSTYDGAVPCANTVMAQNLLALYELTEDEAYLEDASALLRGISSQLSRNPVSTALATVALKRFVDEHPLRSAALSSLTHVDQAVVQLQTSTAEVRVSKDETAEFEVTLTIANGYHINAHDPGQAYLIGLNVRLLGAGGLEIELEYPEGELFRDEIRIHHGTVILPVRITRVGEMTGEPKLMVTYQVCTDQLCLAPTTKAVPVTIVAESSGD